ncbi:MAG: RNA polymerase sigma factor [Saprospiraceae bacterium]|nr:RNA polymerase sigma factor [Saprospiraceae bacterium]MBX7164101.1 RNA polymerase sigma factor [Saprospiraceae bacterium]
MSAVDDEQILDWALDSVTREKGFRALIQKYQQKLYWHIRRMVLNHDDADDVLQNTFIKVNRSLENFERKSSLFTWMYRIATNETLTFLEKNKKYTYDALDDMTEHPAISKLKADPYFEGDELSLKLEEVMQQLPEKQRVVFQMRYYDKMPYKEIAEILQTSEGALKASYHHAMKKIEEHFKSNDKIK